MAFYSNCGTQYNDGARFCPRCRAAAVAQPMAPPAYTPPPSPYGGYVPPPQPMPYPGMQAQPRYGGKSKTTAIILAFFFGPLSWLYTFKKDWSKFLVALARGVISFMVEINTANFTIGYILGPAVWLWAFISALTRGSDWYAQY